MVVFSAHEHGGAVPVAQETANAEPSTRARAGVLDDVDGTLLDTNYLHTLAWARALSEAGEWAPMNAIHRLVGMGADHLLPELSAATSTALGRHRDVTSKS